VSEPTPSQTVGPFFGFAMPFTGGETASDDPAAVRIEGQILDGDGRPVPDAILEAWTGEQFARSATDSEGVYHLVIAKPVAKNGRAPHLDVLVFARGLLRQVTTRIYFPDESAANDRDEVLSAVPADRRATLIARAEGAVLRFDIRLQGPGETVFFEL
jgi:protocatechuate 3,4-dioxygenase alpha subunit